MEPLMGITASLTALSSLLLIALLTIYAKNLRKVKSKFTIGLVLFALLLLAQNLASLYFYFTMMGYYVPQVTLHVFILTLLQVIAFSILLKISWE
jgi:hypothetical protein